jgi:hypothetical protein
VGFEVGALGFQAGQGLAHRRDPGVGQVRPRRGPRQTRRGGSGETHAWVCAGSGKTHAESSRLRCRGSLPLRPPVDDLGRYCVTQF